MLPRTTPHQPSHQPRRGRNLLREFVLQQEGSRSLHRVRGQRGARLAGHLVRESRRRVLCRATSGGRARSPRTPRATPAHQRASREGAHGERGPRPGPSGAGRRRARCRSRTAAPLSRRSRVRRASTTCALSRRKCANSAPTHFLSIHVPHGRQHGQRTQHGDAPLLRRGRLRGRVLQRSVGLLRRSPHGARVLQQQQHQRARRRAPGAILHWRRVVPRRASRRPHSSARHEPGLLASVMTKRTDTEFTRVRA